MKSSFKYRNEADDKICSVSNDFYLNFVNTNIDSGFLICIIFQNGYEFPLSLSLQLMHEMTKDMQYWSNQLIDDAIYIILLSKQILSYL